MPEERNEKELKNHTIVFMVIVAIFFDMLQWLLAFVFMDWLVSIFAYLTFFVWFRTYHISFMKPKRVAIAGISFLLEIIPFVAMLPALTGAVVMIALDTKVKKVLPGVIQDISPFKT